MIRRLLLIQTCLYVSILTVQAQKSSLEIGAKLINELADWTTYAPGGGAQFVLKLTMHSGIETGLYYKLNPRVYYFSYEPTGLSKKKFTQKVILVPLVYRYDSRSINFTAGLAVDYLVNREQLKKTHALGLPDEYYNRFELVSTISLSKSFYLHRSLVLEPEIRANAFVPAGGGGVALNVSLRKQFF